MPTELQEFLDKITRDFPSVIGEPLIGVYLYGSLSYGDFEPHRSDVDVLVVLKRELSDAEYKRLGAWCASAASSPWFKRTEMDLVVLDTLVTSNFGRFPTTHLSGGELKRAHDADAGNPNNWINMYDCGVTLVGPEPKEFVPEVGEGKRMEGFRRTFDNLRSNAAEWEKRDLWNQVYIVTVLALVAYNIRTKTMTSKKAALRAAGEHMPEFAPAFALALVHIDDYKHDRSPVLEAAIPKLIAHVDSLFLE